MTIEVDLVRQVSQSKEALLVWLRDRCGIEPVASEGREATEAANSVENLDDMIVLLAFDVLEVGGHQVVAANVGMLHELPVRSEAHPRARVCIADIGWGGERDLDRLALLVAVTEDH